MVIVVTLLTYGCPLQAIVHAFGLDERTRSQPGEIEQECIVKRCTRRSLSKASWRGSHGKS
jgi:hypothetical protein